MQSKLLSLGLLAAAGTTTVAQTPPYFEPSTNVNLPATFDVNSTTPDFFEVGGVFSINATQSTPQLFLPANSTFSTSSSNSSSSSTPSSPSQPATFIILMVDPDAPSPQDPSRAQILHWLQPGVRLSRSIEPTPDGNGTLLAMLSAASTATPPLVPYTGPAPPSTAPHRYIVLLFREPDASSADQGDTAAAGGSAGFALPEGYEQYAGGKNRTGFNASAFVEAAGLDAPLAATYFLAGKQTAGDGNDAYDGADAAAGIGGNTSVPTGASATPSGSGATPAASGSGDAAAAPSSGAERLGVGALVGGVFGAMALLG